MDGHIQSGQNRAASAPDALVANLVQLRHPPKGTGRTQVRVGLGSALLATALLVVGLIALPGQRQLVANVGILLVVVTGAVAYLGFRRGLPKFDANGSASLFGTTLSLKGVFWNADFDVESDIVSVHPYAYDPGGSGAGGTVVRFERSGQRPLEVLLYGVEIFVPTMGEQRFRYNYDAYIVDSGIAAGIKQLAEDSSTRCRQQLVLNQEASGAGSIPSDSSNTSDESYFSIDIGTTMRFALGKWLVISTFVIIAIMSLVLALSQNMQSVKKEEVILFYGVIPCIIFVIGVLVYYFTTHKPVQMTLRLSNGELAVLQGGKNGRVAHCLTSPLREAKHLWHVAPSEGSMSAGVCIGTCFSLVGANGVTLSFEVPLMDKAGYGPSLQTQGSVTNSRGDAGVQLPEPTGRTGAGQYRISKTAAFALARWIEEQHGRHN